VGGTSTRWAVADATGRCLAEGQAPGFSGLQLADDAGRAAVGAVLGAIRRSVREAVDGPPDEHALSAVCAGVTGFDGDQPGPLVRVLAEGLGVAPDAVTPYNDIELACRAVFPPGGGVLVYSGTGSVAAHLDAQGVVHRAGGRGGLIDDGGSGYWLAREALRCVWRMEDERPGAGLRSGLGRALSARLGGARWGDHRRAAYGATRGELGTHALAVAEAARDGDAQALALLTAAGEELARLARALLRLHGPRPVRLAGRVFELHPEIERSLRWALPAVEVQSPAPLQAHRWAATHALERR
jgi:N-acetylglucosamine kinase-like BadF-type ATPase